MSGFSNDIPRLERVLCTMFTTYLGVFACHSLTVRLLTGVIKKKRLCIGYLPFGVINSCQNEDTNVVVSEGAKRGGQRWYSPCMALFSNSV